MVFALASYRAVHACAHTHSITDVTRIQEGVVAYYVLTAHTGCLAWLGLFKRLRLDKERGLRSRLISCPSLPYLGVALCLTEASTFFSRNANMHTKNVELSLSCRIPTLLYQP